jgi:hypothetical protein
MKWHGLPEWFDFECFLDSHVDGRLIGFMEFTENLLMIASDNLFTFPTGQYLITNLVGADTMKGRDFL